MAKASIMTDMVANNNNNARLYPLAVDPCSYGGCVNCQSQVLVELLRHIPPLSSEEPEDILKFFVRLQQIYNL
jgi:hypothetical protein